MPKQETTGFTLVELAVVIAIMALLVAIIMPVFSSISRSNNQQTCANNLRNIGVLLAQYRQDNGVYPAAPLPAYLRKQSPLSLPFSDPPTQFTPVIFTGNDPLNDCTAAGLYTGSSAAQYLVQIDNVSGPVDTFKWSADGGNTWTGTGTAISATGAAQLLSNGVTVAFVNATGHQFGDTWSCKVTPNQVAAATVFSGIARRNDCQPGGSYSGQGSVQYTVQIDGAGNPNTFKWSTDGGNTWSAKGISISTTGAAQLLSNGVTVTFANAVGHQIGDTWTFTTASTLVTTGIFNARNDCTPGGVYRGKTPVTHYLVQIDAVNGVTDTYRWSTNGGNIWTANGLAISAGTPQTLSNGVQVTFAHATGHQVGDTWSFSTLPVIAAPATGQVLLPIPLVKPANAGDAAVTIPVAAAAGLSKGMIVLLHDAEPNSDTYETSDAVEITGIQPDQNPKWNIVTFKPPLLNNNFTVNTYVINPKTSVKTITGTYTTLIQHNYTTQDANGYYGVMDPRIGNLGLATLYYQANVPTGSENNNSPTDTGSIERTFSPSIFHCPQITTTESVDRTANISAMHTSTVSAELNSVIPSMGTIRRFDPLWGGFNTYDTTYNYDQYDPDIAAYDSALGFGDLNRTRQLKNPNAPADTVVCWCYGHRTEQLSTYPQIVFVNSIPVPDFSASVDTSLPVAQQVRQATDQARHKEGGEHTERNLVLWVDGSVNTVTPTLAPSKTNNWYFWTPPFLSSPGDWRK